MQDGLELSNFLPWVILENFVIVNKYDPYSVKDRLDAFIGEYMVKNQNCKESHKPWFIKTFLEVLVGFPLIFSYLLKMPWAQKRVYCLLAALWYFFFL